MDTYSIGTSYLVIGYIPVYIIIIAGVGGFSMVSTNINMHQMIFLYLFYTFFKIGLFGFGGGYAMLSLIQGEVVTRYHWINAGEFTDIVAISQMTPGPIGINSATYVGYTAVLNAGYSEAFAVIGSIVATFAVVFPSFILMIAISKFFLKYQNTRLLKPYSVDCAPQW